VGIAPRLSPIVSLILPPVLGIMNGPHRESREERDQQIKRFLIEE
jgi:hypothetical protein